MYKSTVLIPFLIVKVLSNTNYSAINLPKEHLPFYFYNFPTEAEKCLEDETCPYRDQIKNQERCWGYEHKCKWNNQYSMPNCPGDHKGWVKTKIAQKTTFHAQADFGYVKQQLREMKILCEPLFKDDSSLECSEHMRHCRGRNILLNFTNLSNREEPIRYKMDVLGEGDIGGYCDLHVDRLKAEADHISPLQSWGPEIRYFTRLKRRPIVEGDCDIVIEKPTFILKIDAINMYHHFCDFLNLYASLHVNASHPEAFSTDVQILIWETFTYRSAFQDTWEAFTNHPLWDLKTFRGETVCFKNVVFPLLPRMIFGLYYNTPIIYGCEKSGLFDSFSKHILHRLKIPLYKRMNRKIRITFLSRNTKYRRVLNEDALLEAIRNYPEYEVERVVYDQDMPFKKQLEISGNSDVFIGIHGAGLTHLLFLPEWATLFELYNCEDPNCYFDLSRLKGIKYITWKDEEKLKSVKDESYDGGAHAKFANYYFDKEEFVELVNEAAVHVRNHTKFQKFMEELANEKHQEECDNEKCNENLETKSDEKISTENFVGKLDSEPYEWDKEIQDEEGNTDNKVHDEEIDIEKTVVETNTENHVVETDNESYNEQTDTEKLNKNHVDEIDNENLDEKLKMNYDELELNPTIKDKSNIAVKYQKMDTDHHDEL